MNGIIAGLGIPVIGTVLGAACVFFIKDKINPYLNKALLGFAAGAMMYVVVEELIPETQSGDHSNLGTIGFAIGFVIMMILDSVL